MYGNIYGKNLHGKITKTYNTIQNSEMFKEFFVDLCWRMLLRIKMPTPSFATGKIEAPDRPLGPELLMILGSDRVDFSY